MPAAVPGSGDELDQQVGADDEEDEGARSGGHGATDGGADRQVVDHRRRAGEHVHISLVLLQEGDATPHHQHIPLPGSYFLPTGNKYIM